MELISDKTKKQVNVDSTLSPTRNLKLTKTIFNWSILHKATLVHR
jgi:hypothetical protein